MPRVAMNELTRSLTTMNPDTKPTEAQPSTATTAPAAAGSPLWICSHTLMAIASDIIAPIERSYAPAASGTRNARASTHVTAPWLKTSFTLTDDR